MHAVFRAAAAAALLVVSAGVAAEAELRCPQVSVSPTIDGRDSDAAWSAAKALTTRDVVADIEHTLRCVHDGERVFIVASFPDEDENRDHKPLVWDAAEERYRIGPEREDTLVLKWNMEPLFTDISLSADAPYRADIWYWKSVRTDHAGYADDKYQVYSEQPGKKATRLLSKSARRFYLTRHGDGGRSAYKAETPDRFMGERLPGYAGREPLGSRADVRALGHWADGRWTIEFGRKLNTGHDDDVQFVPQRRYLFGIARFEVAGRRPDPDLQIPLFGSGEVGESLVLILEGAGPAR